jgi:ABC-type transport system substrate-binding protein
MQEHVAVTVTKIGLLGVVAVTLVLTFKAHNDTQDKVIETARRVDALVDQVADVKRMLRAGASTVPSRGPDAGAPGTSPTPGTPRPEAGTPGTSTTETPRTGPRTPGWTVLLSSEDDRERPPDEEIDFDAEFRSGLLGEPKGFNLYTSDRDAMVATDIGWYVYGPLAERKTSDRNDWKPYLAEWIEESPDHKEYRVWLRPGVKWHRPSVDLTDPKYAWMKGDHEVTADDLVFTLTTILDKRADTDAVRPSFDDPVAGVAEFKAESKHVFYLRWKAANYFARGTLLSDLQPLPKWIFAHEEDGTPIDEASLGQKFATHWFNKRMCGYGP